MMDDEIVPQRHTRVFAQIMHFIPLPDCFCGERRKQSQKTHKDKNNIIEYSRQRLE